MQEQLPSDFRHWCGGGVVSWPLVKIKDVGRVFTGKTPSKATDEYFGGDIPFVTPAELDGDVYVCAAKQTLNELGAKQIKLLPKDSVMVCCIGSLGKIGIAGLELATNQQINSVVFDEAKVFSKYGFYALSLLRPILEKIAPSTTVPIVNKSNFESLEIPLPPLEEQKRIAAILDKADAIRRKRQQAIKLADDFLRSVFLEMFGDPVTNPKGWEIKKLSGVCTKITDGTHFSPPIVEVGVPYITAKHLKSTGLEFFKNPWYISKEHHNEIYSRCKPEMHDVLYIKDGATTGLAAINEYDFEFSMLSSLALLKPDRNLILPEFLCMFLNHPRSKLVITANMAGAAITRLTLAKIKDVDIPLPNLDLQKKFASIYRKNSESVRRCFSALDYSNAQFQSLSQKAFSGTL